LVTYDEKIRYISHPPDPRYEGATFTTQYPDVHRSRPSHWRQPIWYQYTKHVLDREQARTVIPSEGRPSHWRTPIPFRYAKHILDRERMDDVTYTQPEYQQEVFSQMKEVESVISDIQFTIADIEHEDYYFFEGKTIIGTELKSVLETKYLSPTERTYIGLQKQWQESLQLGTKAKVKKTKKGWLIIPPDTSLDWSKAEIKKAEQLPPVVKQLYQLGFGVTSSLASVLKPGYQAFATRPTVVTPGVIGHPPQVFTRDTHFLSGTDILFEPVGLAPEGSTELIKETGPAGWAGFVAAEVGIGWTTSQLLKPAGTGLKYIGGKVVRIPTVRKAVTYIGKLPSVAAGKIGEYTPKGFGNIYQKLFRKPTVDVVSAIRAGDVYRGGIISQFVYQSPKRYGLEGVYLRGYYPVGKPTVTGSVGLLEQQFDEGVSGAVRFMDYSKSLWYKKRFPWYMEVTELVETPVRVPFMKSVKLSAPLQRITSYTRALKTVVSPKIHTVSYNIGRIVKEGGIWVHKMGSSYQRLLGLSSVTGRTIYYNPLSQKLGLMGRQYGIERLTGKVRVFERGAMGIYSYQDELGKTVLRTPNVWDVGGKVFLPDEYYLGGKLPGGWKVGGQAGYQVSRTPIYGGPSFEKAVGGGFTTGGFPVRTTMTRSEQRFLRLLEEAAPPYEPISRMTPDVITSRFPKVLYLGRKPFKYNMVRHIGSYVFGDIGVQSKLDIYR